jgi:hypothetical protein
MDKHDTSGSRRRGKTLIAAALTVGGAITASAATDQESAPAQAIGFSRPSDLGYFGFGY